MLAAPLNCFLKGSGVACQNRVHQVQVNNLSTNIRQGSGRLWNDDNGVDKRVEESTGSKGAKQQFGTTQSRTGTNKYECENQERKDVLQIVQMRSLKKMLTTSLKTNYIMSACVYRRTRSTSSSFLTFTFFTMASSGFANAYSTYTIEVLIKAE